MVSIKSSYHPIDVAILWCDLSEYTAEILHIVLSHSGNLLKHFPQWPCLHHNLERIYDAVSSGEMPATYLRGPITLHDHVERVYWSIRHEDLRIWFARNLPDQKPAFLFPQQTDHLECVSLGAYLAMQAERDFNARECEKIRQAYQAASQELETCRQQLQAAAAQIDGYEPTSESSASVYYTIIGALLATVVGKSQSGQLQSIYSTQAALVEAIQSQFPGRHGLSKHTLDRKFASARRHLALTARV